MYICEIEIFNRDNDSHVELGIPYFRTSTYENVFTRFYGYQQHLLFCKCGGTVLSIPETLSATHNSLGALYDGTSPEAIPTETPTTPILIWLSSPRFFGLSDLAAKGKGSEWTREST